jgi:hypothetical protein
MQHWVDLIPTAGVLINLAAAATNLATTIIKRHDNTHDWTDDGTRQDSAADSLKGSEPTSAASVPSRDLRRR